MYFGNPSLQLRLYGETFQDDYSGNSLYDDSEYSYFIRRLIERDRERIAKGLLPKHPKLLERFGSMAKAKGKASPKSKDKQAKEPPSKQKSNGSSIFLILALGSALGYIIYKLKTKQGKNLN